jgi:hypothetical protein
LGDINASSRSLDVSVFRLKNHLPHPIEQTLGMLTIDGNELYKSQAATGLRASNIAKTHFSTTKENYRPRITAMNHSNWGHTL